jgi:hypothetical protein
LPNSLNAPPAGLSVARVAVPGVIARQGLWWLAAAALVLLAGQYMLYAVAAIRFPFGLDYSEGLVWQQALWLGGPHLYGDIKQFPFLVCQYPPLFLIAVRGLAATGIGMLQAGRILSVASTLVSCVLIGCTVRRMCCQPPDEHARQNKELERDASIKNDPALAPARTASLAGAIAGLLPLTMLPVISWSALMRVDMLALALTYAGIFCACVSFRRRPTIFAALLFFVASAFTKQIYIAGAMAMFPVCLIRSPRHTLGAYAGGALLGVGLIGGLEWLTQGRFLRHILGYTADTVDPLVALRQTALWLGAYPVYAGFTVVAVVLLLRRSGLDTRRGLSGLVRSIRTDEHAAWLAFLTLYLLLTSVLLIAAGKTGAALNYFIEWMCCWCLWLGCLVALILGRPDAPKPLRVLFPALILLQLLPVGAGIHILRTQQFSQQRLADWGGLLARVRGIPGPLLSDDMVLTIEAGRDVTLEPAVLHELAKVGLWHEQELIDKLRAHYFAAVITAYDPGNPTFDARFWPKTQAALLAAYPHVEKFGDYRLRLQK